jgi:hypothetical protein
MYLSFGCVELMELEKQLVEKELKRVKEESEQLRLELLNQVKSNLDDLSFDELLEIRNIIRKGEC